MENKLNQLFVLLCYYFGCQKGGREGTNNWLVYRSRYLATKEAYCIMSGKTPEEVAKEVTAAVTVE